MRTHIIIYYSLSASKDVEVKSITSKDVKVKSITSKALNMNALASSSEYAVLTQL